MNYLVQKICIGSQCIDGPFPTDPATGQPIINTLGDLVNKLLQFVFPLAVVILFFVFVWGGYDFLLSRGEAEKVKSAQAKLTTGVIGFILLVTAYFITRLIAAIFGLEGGIL